MRASSTSKIAVPFGKYRGQPVEVLVDDVQYAGWLAAQPWFREKYPNLHAIVADRAGLPQDPATTDPEQYSSEQQPLSLAETERQLALWGVAIAMWHTARTRGMPEAEFERAYRRFVDHNHGRRNRAGLLVLGSRNRALRSGWYWLRDHGCPSAEFATRNDPAWREVRVGRTRHGQPISFRLFVNPDRLREEPPLSGHNDGKSS
jgi:hypothetical protein